MTTWKNGQPVLTRKCVSASGCRTSRVQLITSDGVTFKPIVSKREFVENDWTEKTCKILGMLPIIPIDKDRPSDTIPWTGESARLR